MIPYVRLVYASTATADPANICHDLNQIMDNARQYNFNHQLTGVLLYGNGYFLHYVEGKKTEVDRLYRHLSRDSWYQNISLLLYETAAQPRFEQWQLRYIHFEPPIENFIQQHYPAGFNPYLIDSQGIHFFIDILYRYDCHHSLNSMQAIKNLEAGQSSYVMGLKDMAMVGMIILLIVIPLYLIVGIGQGMASFFPF